MQVLRRFGWWTVLWLRLRPILFITLICEATSSLAFDTGFNNPTDELNLARSYSSTGHCGNDYNHLTIRNAAIYSTSYGVIERVVNNLNTNYPPLPPSYTTCSNYSANLVLIKHISTSGDVRWTRYLHLAQGATTLVTSNERIVKSQKIGIEGNTGCSSGNHLHYEVNTKISANSVGALPERCEDTTLATNATTPVPYLENGNAKVLLPFFSRSQISPNENNYDVYGVVNQPLYGSLALKPTEKKTFNNVGVGGVMYGTTTSDDLFTNPSIELLNTSAALTGKKSFTTVGDRSFYAYSNEFKRGYEIKFSILPQGSEVIDNDGRLSKLDGDQSAASRQGYFVAYQNDNYADGSQDVPGYYLSAKLFKGGASDKSANWVRWFPSNNGTYEISVHVPKGATATNVTYKIYTKGKPADGICSATNKDNPCFISDAVNQSQNQDKWVKLTYNTGKTTQFDIATSATNGAYVGLSVGDIADTTYVGVDAVKFVSVSITAPTGLYAVAVSATSVNLTWTDNSNNETGFTVQRKLSTETDTAWKAVKTLAADAKVYTDTGLTASKTYNYRVYASNASGNSGYSNVATVKPVANTPPTATTQTNLKVNEDTALPITLAGTDPENDPLTYAITTQPANGTLSALKGNKLTYTPKLNFFGVDSFKFKVNDGKTDSAPATISISVTAVNDAPVAKTLSFIVNQNTRSSITLQGTDAEDALAKLTFTIATPPSKGKLEAVVGNKMVYTPNNGYSGKDSFTYKVTDTGKTASAPATVSIEVKAPVPTPAITSITPLTGKVGQTVTLSVSGSNLPATIMATIAAQKVGCTTATKSATAATFNCLLDVAGSQALTVRTNTAANGGVVISGGSATFVVSSVLTTPQNLKATAGDGKVTLSWDAVSGAANYAYCQSTLKDSPDCTTYSVSNPLWKDTANITETISGLINDTPYYFRVVAKTASGKESAVSGEVTATPTATTQTTSCPKSVKSILFKDSFDGASIDTTKWDVDQIGGSVILLDGKLSVLSKGTNRFPVVQTKADPFPTSGNFSFYCKAKYTNIGSNGTGACVGVQKMITNGSASLSYDSGTTLQLWADTALGGADWRVANTMYGGTPLFENITPNDLADHEYETCVIGSQIIGYRDGIKIGEATLPNNWAFPTKIWIGNPVLGSAGYAWSTFDTDAVEVRQLEDGIDPTGWIQNPTTKHYYKALNNCGNWEQCEKVAQTVNAHLVTINDQQENAWLINTFGDGPSWIGLTRKEPFITWNWVNGEPVTYTNWHMGAYGSYRGTNANYVLMNFTAGFEDYGMGYWINSPLDAVDPFVLTGIVERIN